MGALRELAAAHGNPRPALTTDEIVQRGGWPRPFLAKVLTVLSARGLIRGVRGPGGGYVLAREPAEITLAQVAACFERAQGPVRCPLGHDKLCRDTHPCPIHDAMLRVKESVDSLLQGTTLAEFQAGDPSPGGPSAH
jgi:Rrf2 family protein